MEKQIERKQRKGALAGCSECPGPEGMQANSGGIWRGAEYQKF